MTCGGATVSAFCDAHVWLSGRAFPPLVVETRSACPSFASLNPVMFVGVLQPREVDAVLGGASPTSASVCLADQIAVFLKRPDGTTNSSFRQACVLSHSGKARSTRCRRLHLRSSSKAHQHQHSGRLKRRRVTPAMRNEFEAQAAIPSRSTESPSFALSACSAFRRSDAQGDSVKCIRLESPFAAMFDQSPRRDRLVGVQPQPPAGRWLRHERRGSRRLRGARRLHE